MLLKKIDQYPLPGPTAKGEAGESGAASDGGRGPFKQFLGRSLQWNDGGFGESSCPNLAGLNGESIENNIGIIGMGNQTLNFP